MDFHTAVGDILLVTGTAVSSKGLVGAQKVLYPEYSDARSSHVAISLTDGCFIHSTVQHGVHFEPIKEILKDCHDGWRVIRLRGLNAEQNKAILAGANYYLAQSYNLAYMKPENPSSSFCSELAAKAYKRAGIEILGGLDPSQVTPAHFDIEADKLEAWEDVTEDYRRLIAHIDLNPELYAFGFMMLATSLARLRRTNERTEMLFKFADSLLKSDESRAELMQHKQALEDAKLFNFWDIKAANPGANGQGKDGGEQETP